MMRLNVLALTLAAIGVAACSDGAKPESHDGPAGHQHGAAAKEPASPAAAPAAAPAGHEFKKLATPSANYPLKTCVISGDELGGSMGPALAYSYDGTEVQFCCPDCPDKFMQDPAKYLAQIRAAKK